MSIIDVTNPQKLIKELESKRAIIIEKKELRYEGVTVYGIDYRDSQNPGELILRHDGGAFFVIDDAANNACRLKEMVKKYQTIK